MDGYTRKLENEYKMLREMYEHQKKQIAELKENSIPSGTHSYFARKDKERLEKMKFLTPDFSNLTILN